MRICANPTLEYHPRSITTFGVGLLKKEKPITEGAIGFQCYFGSSFCVFSDFQIDKFTNKN